MISFLLSTYYGEQEELTGKTPADLHGGSLLDKHIWDEKEWGAFYTTCVYCLDQCLKQGLQKFEDSVLQERQLFKVFYGVQMLLKELTAFIEEEVKNGGEVSKEEVVAFSRATLNLNASRPRSRTGRPRPSRRSALGWDTAETLIAKATVG